MTKTNFNEQVIEKVREALGEGYSVNLQEVAKGNGVIKSALQIKSEDSNVAPLIYLEALANVYEAGQITMEGVINEIVELSKEKPEGINAHIESYMNFSCVKDRLRVKLVNYEMNKDFLKDKVYVRVLDLAAIACVDFSEDFDFSMSSCVTRNTLEFWKVDDSVVNKIAFSNTNNLSTITPMSQEIMRILEMEEDTGIKDLFESDEVDSRMKLYIASNKSRIFGAPTMLDTETLKSFCKEIESEKLIILPSSIHECILVSDKEFNDDYSYLYEMVREVNNTMVKDVEILSYSVYGFDSTMGTLTIK